MSSERRLERIQAVTASRQQGVIVLEDIHDPHNAQAVFRTCDALGFQHVYLIFEQEKPFEPRAIGQQSSSSANKWLTFTIFQSTKQCLEHLRDEQYQIIATVPDSNSEGVFSAKLLNPRIALMLGNEHRGLSSMAIETADRRLSIPMGGMVQSLNLSVTAAMLLYEITRQRITAGIEGYRLPVEQQQALTQEFLTR